MNVFQKFVPVLAAESLLDRGYSYTKTFRGEYLADKSLPSNKFLKGLECVAECGFFESLNDIWSEYIPHVVTLNVGFNTLYAQIGLDEMRHCESYKLNLLTISCNNTDVRGKFMVLTQLSHRAKQTILEVKGDCDVRKLLEEYDIRTGDNTE